MRVSDKVLYNTVTNNLQQNLEKILGLQEKSSSGKRINRPSDDPVGVMKVVDYDTALSKVGQYQRNIDNGTSFLNVTESTISTAQNIMVRIKELSLSALNSTNSAENRSIIAEEVDQLYQQMKQVANTQFNGRHIFAGYNTETAPYDSNDEYKGTASSDGYIEIEIDSGSTMKINMHGDRVFGTPTYGTDILGTLSTLKSALENDDLQGIGDAMDDIDAAMEQLANVRAEIGARLNRLETAKDYLSKLELDLTGFKSKIEDADITKVITELAMQQTTLEVSRAAVARVLSQSLLDFLK